MSDQNQKSHELFDVDVDVKFRDTSSGNNINATTSKNTTTSPAIRATTPFTLPDGRMIDGKNTLQSFDTAVVVQQSQHLTNSTTSSSSATKPLPFPAAFIGPPTPWVNNRIESSQNIDVRINHRNAVVEQKSETTTSFKNIVTTGIMTQNSSRTNNHSHTHINNNDTVAVRAEAMPVRSFAVVEAEMLDSQLPEEFVHPHRPSNRGISWLVVVVIVILTCAATGVGVYCGTGNCGGGGVSTPVSGSVTTNNSNNTNPVTLPPIASTPVAVAQQPSSIRPIKTPSSIPTTTPTSNMVVPTNPPTGIPTSSPKTETPTLDSTISPVSLTDVPVAKSAPTDELTVGCSFLSLTNLTECQTTTLFSGSITGNAIPTEIGWLTKLTHLYLRSRELTGTIPSSLGNLIQLTYLDLYDNQFTGTIPSTLGNLLQLEWLDLEENRLSGTIPSTLGASSQLTALGFGYNQLNGTIPFTLGNLTKLNRLYFNDNRFAGTVPSTLGSLTLLSELYFYNNTQLGGTVPPTLCSLGITIEIGCNNNMVCSCCSDAMTGLECGQ